MADLLVRNAELLVTCDAEKREIPGGWVAITGGMVEGVGAAGDEPAAGRTIDATGCLVTPGLINTHHHLYQNLTRAHAPAVSGTLFQWLQALYPLWARLDEEAAHVSAWVGLAELALGGCTRASSARPTTSTCTRPAAATSCRPRSPRPSTWACASTQLAAR
jgi:cytosine/adenosine deaminase-related metal-dependent hydrolase